MAAVSIIAGSTLILATRHRRRPRPTHKRKRRRST
jgi:hypothetical protein